VRMSNIFSTLAGVQGNYEVLCTNAACITDAELRRAELLILAGRTALSRLVSPRDSCL